MLFGLLAVPVSYAEQAFGKDVPELTQYEIIGDKGYEARYTMDEEGNVIWNIVLNGVTQSHRISSLDIRVSWDNTQLSCISFGADDLTYHNSSPSEDRPAYPTVNVPDGEEGSEFIYAFANINGAWFADNEDGVIASIKFKVLDGVEDGTKCNISFYYTRIMFLVPGTTDFVDETTYVLTAYDGYIIAGERPSANYTITHYTEQLDGTYSIFDTETGHNWLGETITPTPRDIEGFTFDSTVEGSIIGGEVSQNDELALALYYTRNEYLLSYYLDGEQYSQVSLPYKTPITALDSPQVEDGMVFSGWSEIPATMPAHDVDVIGSIAPIVPPSANYTVKRYVEQLGGGYTLCSTEILTANVGATVFAAGNALTGFTLNPSVAGSVSSGVVTQDGLLTLVLFYTRNNYLLSYYLDGELYTQMRVDYEQRVIPIADPQAPTGKKFSGWSEIPTTMPANDVRIDGSFLHAGVMGDTDCNGRVTAADAAGILRHIVKIHTISEYGLINGDVDKDGKISANDAAMILRYLVHLVTSLD
ncbi:MAG: dockerin type I repeat-containing protein [Eubacteriales bacterium]|nr:dockerin type I repeat-containing protein [Eubacteriales bacterium]